MPPMNKVVSDSLATEGARTAGRGSRWLRLASALAFGASLVAVPLWAGCGGDDEDVDAPTQTVDATPQGTVDSMPQGTVDGAPGTVDAPPDTGADGMPGADGMTN